MMSIVYDFRHIPDFAPKNRAMGTAAPLRHEINEATKRVASFMNGAAIVDRLHDELDAIFPGTTRDT
jgi:hypothetical protein